MNEERWKKLIGKWRRIMIYIINTEEFTSTHLNLINSMK